MLGFVHSLNQSKINRCNSKKDRSLPNGLMFGRSLLLWALILLFCVGCGTGRVEKSADRPAGKPAFAGDGAQDAAAQPESGNEEAVLRIPKRQTGSRIMLDERGYDRYDTRVAYFAGEDLGDVFYLVSAADDTRVFEGTLEPVTDESVSGNSLYRGDFSAYTGEGTFYLQAAVIGQSERFTIEEDFYRKQRDALASAWQAQTEALCQKESLTADEQAALAAGLFSMGMACELFPEEAKGLTKICQSCLQQAEGKLQTQQDPETGAVYLAALVQAAVISDAEGGSGLSEKALSLYDTLVRECTETDYARILADAAVYKLTGDRTYAALPESYLSGPCKLDEKGFVPVFLYLTTKTSVDTEICSELMKTLIRHCNGAAQSLKDEGDLFDAQLLSLADYILSSKEYGSLRRAFYHNLSLMGEFEGESESPKNTAQLFLALCFGS